MLNKIKNTCNLFRNMGWRYVSFRGVHELKVRSGFFRKQFPISPKSETFISLKNWKEKNLFFINGRISFSKPVSEKLENDFRNLIGGKISFFNSEIFDLGADYDWVTNPTNGYKYDRNCHWTKIIDYDPENGDIKYVWEKSRFSYLSTVIRYDAYTDEDHSAFLWKEINSWMDANPINAGPNFKCSQEISLRVFNWTIALNFYKDSPSLTEEFFQKVMHYVYWQLRHIYSNIHFSRIAVRNNHAITETLALYLGGLLFPFFPEADVWKKKGKMWFEKEIAYQIYEDGTFLQFSMNYHRVVVQLLSFAFAVTQKNEEKFSVVVYERAYKSLNFLVQNMEPTNGSLPNYGSNDGALFFRFSDLDFRDYRPQLSCLHKFLTGGSLFETENNFQIQEESKWMDASLIPGLSFALVNQTNGWHEFTDGGYYLLREATGLTFIRCGNYKDRPAQADNLHIDIWYNGQNVLYDGGSYKYNTTPKLLNYFMGTASHNTVMLDQNNQMRKGARFIWYYWTQADYSTTNQNEEEYIFEGQVKVYGYIDKKIRHRRKVIKNKNKPEWKIVDEILNKPKGMTMSQLFHYNESMIQIKPSNPDETIEVKKLKGYKSDYYGVKNDISYYSINTAANKIETILRAQ